MLRDIMSDTQQYCLKWNNYTDNVLSAFELLRDQEEFVDVTLSCEGSQVKAHKVVLSACSAYFQKILKENPCQHPIIILKDVPVVDLNSLVHFMYHGQVMVEQERIPRLLSTAQLLQVRGLCDVRSVHNLNGTASESVMNALQAATAPSGMPQVPAAAKQTLTAVKKNIRVPAQRPIPMLQSIIAAEQAKQGIPGATVFGSQIVTSVPLLALAQAAATASPAIVDIVGRAGSDTPSEDADEVEKRPASKKRKKTYESYPPPTPVSTTTMADDTETDDLDKDLDTDSDAALVIKEEPDVNFNDDDNSKRGYESDSENEGESGNEGSMSGSEKRMMPLLPKQLFSKGMLSAAAKLQAVANQAKGISSPQLVDSKSSLLSSINSGDLSSDDQPRKLAFHEPRPCSICGRMYRDAATLRTHTAIMHAEGKEAFVCSCGESFKTKYEMYMHKKNGHRSGV